MMYHILGILFIIPAAFIAFMVYQEKMSVNYLIGIFVTAGVYFLVIGQISPYPTEKPARVSEAVTAPAVQPAQIAQPPAETPAVPEKKETLPVTPQNMPDTANTVIPAAIAPPLPVQQKIYPVHPKKAVRKAPVSAPAPKAVEIEPVKAEPVISEPAAAPPAGISEVKKPEQVPAAEPSSEANNKIAELGRRCIDEGSRASYEELIAMAESSESADKETAQAASEALDKVKQFYRTMEAGSSANLDYHDKDGKTMRNEDIPTDDLIFVLNHGEWQLRVLAARLLASRREAKVPDVLIGVIGADARLDVVRQAVISFEKLTGYETSNALPIESIQIWWSDHRQAFLKPQTV